MIVISQTMKKQTDPELEEMISLIEREISFLSNLAYALSNPQAYEGIRSTLEEKMFQHKQLLAERNLRIRQGCFRPFLISEVQS